MNTVERIVELVENATGIALDRGGRAGSVGPIVEDRVRELGLRDPDAYVALLLAPANAELPRLINAVTVNYTWFFRDLEQMESIRGLLRSAWDPGRELAIWVSACSTGDDAYTLSMLARSVQRPAHILGTDINSEALAQARSAYYGVWSVRDVPTEFHRYLIPHGEKQVEIDPTIRRGVNFERHNLVDAPPVSPGGKGWDLILCRNVLIYFLPERGLETMERLGLALTLDGWLTLGGSEVLHIYPKGLRVARMGNRIALRRLDAPQAIGFEEVTLPVEVPVFGRDGSYSLSTAVPMATVPLLYPAAPDPRVPVIPPPPAPPTLFAGAVTPPAPPAAIEAQPPPIVFIGPSGYVPGLAEVPPVSRDTVGAMALLEAGNARLEAGERAQALTLFHRAIELDPLSAEAYMFLGIAFHQMGDAGAAMQALRGALFLDASLWAAAFYLALSYDTLGRGADAQREYRRAVEAGERSTRLQSGGVVAQILEAWKQDVLSLSRKRASGSRTAVRGQR